MANKKYTKDVQDMFDAFQKLPKDYVVHLGKFLKDREKERAKIAKKIVKAQNQNKGIASNTC